MIRVGLIGLGNHMTTQIVPRLLNLPVIIASVCDKDIKKMIKFCTHFPLSKEHCYITFTEMMEKEELDAVVCVGNAKLHYEGAKASLLHHLPVFVEKTPCENTIQAKELRKLQIENNCFGMAGFNRRFTTSYRLMRQIINDDKFGRPYMYMAKYNSSPYPDSDYFLFNHVIHHLDLMRYLIGEIQEIYAEKKVITTQKTGYHIRFISESGILGFLQTASIQCESYPMERVEIAGNGGNVIVDNVKTLQYNRHSINKTEINPSISEGENTLCWNYNQGHSSMYSHYGYERELDCFVKAVLGEGKAENTFEEVEKTMALYENLLEHIMKK